MKTIISIGGGSIKDKTTLKIDEYIASLTKERAGEKRAYGLFIGTASHDCMPQFNSFRKTYTSNFDIKADCLLTVNIDTPKEKIDEKFSKADLIYVGGGDTVFMLEKWKEKGITEKIIEAYERGVILCGLSAGAICWFENMYTDSYLTRGESNEYKFHKGLSLLRGTMTPHYNLRKGDFDLAILKEGVNSAYAVEDDSAIVFKNGEFDRSITSGGKSYYIKNISGKIYHEEL
ncbi:MAG: Type 1 glutamine amidotransferase-like domain-containing protein [Clostridia bacterium]|nr:Type 1 glutamine amidotransferase-like domain-containing protein [Clostridia bacterium]